MSKNKILQLNESYKKEEENKYVKSYMFIKGYALAKNLQQTLIALTFARQLHNGQYRKDGMPYIIHPLKVCTTLINYGISDDTVLAASLLHDVLEDCSDKLPLKGKELISDYGIHQEVIDIVTLLTKSPGLSQEELGEYFLKIRNNPKALLVKLSDRLHNSSTIYTFSWQKMRKYVNETTDFVLPMASYGKLYYPQYANALSILKSGIFSLNHSMEIMLDKFEEHDRELQEEIEKLKKQIDNCK